MAVPHLVPPIRMLGDVDVAPKFCPRTVSEAPPETAALGGKTLLILGLSNVN